jgi:hypothetical protein
VKNRLPSEISMHVNMLFVDVYAYTVEAYQLLNCDVLVLWSR